MSAFRNLLTLVLGLISGLFIWQIATLFLQKTPIFYAAVKKEYNFYTFNLTPLFFNENIKKTVKIQSLKGIKLKAVYFNGKKGFIVIEDKGKNHFIDLGKSYNGYKLIKINQTNAIFQKGNKQYKIEFPKEKMQNTFKTIAPIQKVIKRKTFEEYKNNLTKIWQNIGIIKVKEGYMITYIKPHSIFDKIGLKRGDILIEVNGRKLKNDADAWNLYQNADKFNKFEIVIKRNHKTKVLEYEVD